MSGGPALHAWEFLAAHPALSWTPPMWRGVAPDLCAYTLRAVERNLLVTLVDDGHGNALVRLSIGPLQDRELGDGVDPVAPAPVRDPRLDVEAATFEAALEALAARVVDVYGRADVRCARTQPDSARSDSRQSTTPELDEVDELRLRRTLRR